jgi:hypothetical protein
MAKLGTHKRPAVVRVRSYSRSSPWSFPLDHQGSRPTARCGIRAPHPGA